MNIEARDTLRNAVLDTIMKAFPSAQKVAGGVAFMSDVMDEDTGLYFPVEVKVSVKNTADTARSPKYDLDKAVAEYAAKPGRRVADPAKRAAAEAAKAASAQKREANMKVLRAFIAAGKLGDGMIPSAVQAAIPEFKDLQSMQVGLLLKVAVDEGLVTFTIDEKRHKVFTAC